MGCLFILNDFEQDIYWKKNIFKIENFFILESLILFFLSLLSLLIYPFDLLKLLNQKKQKISIQEINLMNIVLSLLSILLSFLIKYIHKTNKIKPISRLCLMKIVCYFNIIPSFIYFFISFYINIQIINLINFIGIKDLQSISSGNKASVYFEKELFIFLLNNIMILCSIFSLFDFFTLIVIISKTSRFLSQGSNINNQKILYELFKIPELKNEKKALEKSLPSNINTFKNKKNIFKLRFIKLPKINKGNNFKNENDSFEEVQIIQKIEYNSIGTQTEEIKNKINNFYINNKVMDEEIANHSIYIGNMTLFNLDSSQNENFEN